MVLSQMTNYYAAVAADFNKVFPLRGTLIEVNEIDCTVRELNSHGRYRLT